MNREQNQQCSQLELHDILEGEGRRSGNFSCKVSIFVLLVETEKFLSLASLKLFPKPVVKNDKASALL